MRQAVVFDLKPLLGARATAPEVVHDDELVRRALGGDRSAEEAIYRRHARAVANLAARMLRSRADAEDVLQETFTIALDRLDQVRDATMLRGWLLGIATSEVRRRCRRRRLLDRLGFARDPDDAGLEHCASPDADAETRAELRRLESALDRVDFDARLAWMLRHVDGHTLPEVAVALGVSLATAKRRLAEADARVREHVGSRPTLASVSPTSRGPR